MNRVEGITKDEVIIINEDETLGYWVNRFILAVILMGIYQICINVLEFPSYAELFNAFADKVDELYS